MLLVGFEPKITVFERAKTVHALDYAVNLVGLFTYYLDFAAIEYGAKQ
jgi:hypothetical protein